MMLVTLQQAREHLRVDTTDGDNDILLKVKAASRAVVTYLKSPSFAESSGEIPEDSAGIAIDVPEDVQIATLMLIGYFDRQRDEDGGHEYELGFLPRPVSALLYPYRVPTCGVTDAEYAKLKTRRCWWRW
jgi:hypothetical protein